MCALSHILPGYPADELKKVEREVKKEIDEAVEVRVEVGKQTEDLGWVGWAFSRGCPCACEQEGDR
jgi:hypothetical protein